MRLNYLEIQGFKSFPDKTKIIFDRPYTAIVGPNGSGKSNISDAVRWVLGEQSTKSLRGGKMEEVIFGGTQMRNPMGFAQVSLCLDNESGRMADAGKKVVVSRRFYRSGDSEYLVNGATVRLRDVREMFMDTGLGRDGYSIIGQGRISEVVAAKSDERREMFEEASGIAKYRFRKNEAHKKLESAEDNLSRLRDILDELKGRIDPLTVQSRKAHEFLALTEQRKSVEVTLYCDTLRRVREEVRLQDDKIAIATRDYVSVEEQLVTIEDKIESFSDRSRKFNADIEGMNAAVLQKGEEASAVESTVAVLQNDIHHGVRQVEVLAAEQETLSKDESGILEEVGSRNLLIAQKQSELHVTQRLIADMEEELRQLVENEEQSDVRRSETTQKLVRLQTEVTDLRVANVAAVSTVNSLSARDVVLEDHLRTMKDHLARAEQESGENQEYVETLSREVAEKENQVRGLSLKLETRRQKLQQVAAEVDKNYQETQTLSNRAQVLLDMDKSMEGYAPGVRRVLEEAEQHLLRGIVGTVASLIRIKAGNETAIETALGMAAQNIVVQDERAAKQAISMLKNSRAGRATFLPLDTIKESRFDARDRLSDPGVVGLASELVSCDATYDAIVSNLLGRIVVTEDLDSASAVAKRLYYRYRVVTQDGQVINAGGSYTGGYTAKQGGLFTRKNEIDKLEQQVLALKAIGVKSRQQYDALMSEISEGEAEMTVYRSEQTTAKEDCIRAEAAQARIAADIASTLAAIAVAEEEAASNAKSKGEQTMLISENEGNITVLSEEIARLERLAGDESASGDTIVTHRNRLTEALSEHKINRVERMKDIESMEQAVETLSRQGGAVDDRMKSIRQAVANIELQNEERSRQIEDALSRAQVLRDEAVTIREEIDGVILQRNAYEREVNQSQSSYGELAKQRESVAKELARLEERKSALQNEFEVTTSRLWEDYELTRAEAEALCVPFENISDLRQKVGLLRAKIKALGLVHVGAIEELAEVTERYEFLSGQVEDVEKSRQELLLLISKIETEMTGIFVKNFHEINNQFRLVFADLFGGGSAALSLSDENDVLESGIEIDVQPPGKVIKNLAALSGGEQALVAIAIYFAILAVNPSPFCVLDEIDSALDEVNVNRFASYLGKVTGRTQVIAITHRRGTMEAADILYGVTMQEEGVSKLLKLGIEEAQLVISQ